MNSFTGGGGLGKQPPDDFAGDRILFTVGLNQGNGVGSATLPGYSGAANNTTQLGTLQNTGWTFTPNATSGYDVTAGKIPAPGAVALLGTTITPYLFFWQASGEVEEKRGVQSLSRTNLDISIGMIWSNLIAFFIIVATGAVLFSHHTQVRTAADAARALG